MLETEVQALLKDLGDDKYTPEFTENSYKYLPFIFGKLRNLYEKSGLKIDHVKHFKITEAQGKFAELIGAKVEEVTGIRYIVETDPGCKDTGLLDGKTEEEKKEIRKGTLQAKGVDFEIVGPGFTDKWDLKTRSCQWLYGDVLLKKNLLEHPDWYETDYILYVKEMPKLEASTICILPVKALQEGYDKGVIWKPWATPGSLMVENRILQKVIKAHEEQHGVQMLNGLDIPIY